MGGALRFRDIVRVAIETYPGGNGRIQTQTLGDPLRLRALQRCIGAGMRDFA